MAETDLELARQRALARAQSQENVIARTPNGGRVVETNGQRSFVSPGYSTTDPASIDRILSGDGVEMIVQDSFDNQILQENPIAARGAAAMQGVPFLGSRVDEAASAMFGEDAGRGIVAAQGAARRQEPGLTTATQLATGIASSVPMAVAAAPAVLPARGGSLLVQGLRLAGAGAFAGGVEGAIYGSGEAEGEGRAANAVEQAKFGAGAGAVLGPVAGAGAAGIKRVLERLRGADVQVIARQLNVSEDAARVIRNEIDAGSLDEAAARLASRGENAMLAEASPALQSVLDASAQTGGDAARITRNALADRTEQASRQIDGAINDTLGAPRGINEIQRGILDETSGLRSTTYDTAYSTPIDYSSEGGQRLQSLLERVPESALRKAESIMAVRGETSPQILASIADNGRVTYETLPDVRQTHYIMQALSDVANSTDGSGTFGRQNTYGAGIQNLRRAISITLGDSVPAFKEAQSIAADTARRREMAEVGQTALRTATTRESVAEALAGATPAERQAAQEGVRSYLDDLTARVTRTLGDPNTETRESIRAMRELSSRSSRDKLRVILGSEADEMLAQIDEAATAFELRAAVAENSKTAVRQSVQRSIEAQTQPGVLRTLAASEPVNSTKLIVQGLTGETAEAQMVRQAGLYAEIAEALTSVRGTQARAALRDIQTAMSGQQLSQAQARRIANVVVTAPSLTAARGAQELNRQ